MFFKYEMTTWEIEKLIIFYWPVLHDPEFLPVHVFSLVAVTHHQHAMVQLLTAAFLLIVDS